MSGYSLFENKAGKTGGVELRNSSNEIVHNVDVAGLVRLGETTKASSLKQVFLAHDITNLNLLLPDAQAGPNSPYLYNTMPNAWVSKVLAAINKLPFSRVKSLVFDITLETARARGYVTGDQKLDSIWDVLTRTTTPQTIYGRNKLDRDDILDITEYDVLMYMKQVLDIKLDEEVARAILVSDGRASNDPYKIKVDKIRPIWGDDELYTHNEVFPDTHDILDVIDGITAARQYYHGSGNPSLYLTPKFLSDMLLVRDTTGRRIHETLESLKAALLVNDIVEVPVMSNLTRTVGADTHNLLAILVNLSDYSVGRTPGSQKSFFSDFDIDFNQMTYLLETRASGALTRPKAAISFEQVQA